MCFFMWTNSPDFQLVNYELVQCVTVQLQKLLNNVYYDFDFVNNVWIKRTIWIKIFQNTWEICVLLTPQKAVSHNFPRQFSFKCFLLKNKDIFQFILSCFLFTLIPKFLSQNYFPSKITFFLCSRNSRTTF